MKYNLDAGGTNFTYPHWTKKMDDTISIISEKPLEIGDSVYSQTMLSINFGPYLIKEILEQRPAKGVHKLNATFQLCRI